MPVTIRNKPVFSLLEVTRSIQRTITESVQDSGVDSG